MNQIIQKKLTKLFLEFAEKCLEPAGEPKAELEAAFALYSEYEYQYAKKDEYVAAWDIVCKTQKNVFKPLFEKHMTPDVNNWINTFTSIVSDPLKNFITV